MRNKKSQTWNIMETSINQFRGHDCDVDVD